MHFSERVVNPISELEIFPFGIPGIIGSYVGLSDDEKIRLIFGDVNCVSFVDQKCEWFLMIKKHSYFTRKHQERNDFTFHLGEVKNRGKSYWTENGVITKLKNKTLCDHLNPPQWWVNQFPQLKKLCQQFQDLWESLP